MSAKGEVDSVLFFSYFAQKKNTFMKSALLLLRAGHIVFLVYCLKTNALIGLKGASNRLYYAMFF